MFDYTVAMQFDDKVFKEYSDKISSIPEIVVTKVLTDVDYSKYQTFYLKGKEIVLKNHAMIDAVFIDSEIDLTQYIEITDCRPVKV